MKIGYIRTSTAGQNTARQEVLMQELGVDQVFIDRMSGKSLERPELKKMMGFVRQGDTGNAISPTRKYESIATMLRQNGPLSSIFTPLNPLTSGALIVLRSML